MTTVSSLTDGHKSNTDKKYSCLEAFYNEDTEPGVQVCWETVVRAVGTYPISNQRLAREIAMKYDIAMDNT